MTKLTKQATTIVIAAVAVLMAIGGAWMIMRKEKYAASRSAYATRIDLGKFTPFKNDKKQCPAGYTNNSASTSVADACRKRRLTVKKQKIRWVKKK
jgi:hypothetical protein